MQFFVPMRETKLYSPRKYWTSTTTVEVQISPSFIVWLL